MLHQPREPLAILDVGLPPGDRLDGLGVDEEELQAALEHLVDGPPVDPGALHRGVGAAGRGQPVGELELFARGGPEGARLLGARPVRTGTPVQDLHGRRLLVAVSRRRRDCVSEYPPGAPRAGGGDSLRCRSSRPGHDGIAGSRHQSKADLCRRDTVRMSLAQLFAFIPLQVGALPHEAMV